MQRSGGWSRPLWAWAQPPGGTGGTVPPNFWGEKNQCIWSPPTFSMQLYYLV